MNAAPTLAPFHRTFLDALLDRPTPPGPPFIECLREQPAFAIYRNTVRKACIDALEANYPAVARLVGSDWFRAAAALHVDASPPGDGRLLHYGAGFADFLAGFEPIAALPYLPGVARLDRFWTEAHSAADAPTADTGVLAGIAPGQLGERVLRPQPAARWAWFDDMPVFSIWCRNRHGTDETDEELRWQGEGALLTRPADPVIWCAIGRADVAFLDACKAGQPLGAAAESALAAEPDADVSALLARLLLAGALTS
ncbi:MAG: DUF2063 domain-containing protein [Variovorax sp.]|nr:MAG: DUF2063 domain-containing protein [Variovorax sp.]